MPIEPKFSKCIVCGCKFQRKEITSHALRCDNCKDKCATCGKALKKHGGAYPIRCEKCRRIREEKIEEKFKDNPIIKKCIKCGEIKKFTKLGNICEDCNVLWRAGRWAKKSDGYKIVRDTDEHRGKQVEYNKISRKENEKLVLEMFGESGEFKCHDCGFKSKIKKQFDFHHLDPSKKTTKFNQKMRRGNLTKEFILNEGVVLLCTNCHRKRHATSKIPKRQMIFSELVKRGLEDKCQVCGETFPICAYDFHHINQEEKEFGISGSRSLGKNIIEAQKCAMICGRCHVLVHLGLVKEELKSIKLN